MGITPVPFQVATVGSSLAVYPLLPFLIAATLARSIRYYGLALLVKLFGRRVERTIKQHQTKAKRVFLALVAFAIAATVSVYAC